MIRELINKSMKEEEIDKIVTEGIKKDFDVMRSDIETLPEGGVKVSTDDSRTFVMLQKLFNFKPV